MFYIKLLEINFICIVLTYIRYNAANIASKTTELELS